jgi:FkbM family methyltransferase
MAATMISKSLARRWTRGISVPFVVGPLRGNWWQLASCGKLGRLFLGSYEPEQTCLFCERIRPGDQVLDIGAAAGYYTLLSAKLVGQSGSVVSFEPDPNNLQFLRNHVAQNSLSQVTILPIALADKTGTARFGGGTGTGTGRLCDEGVDEVAVRRLDDVAAEMSLKPRHLKIDVEGAEMAVLQGGEKTIRTHRPTIFLSTHEGVAPGIHRGCRELLKDWGYRLSPITGDSLDQSSELLCVAN